MQTPIEKEKSKAYSEGFHFVLCICFFLITLYFTIKLTKTLQSMPDVNGDENALTAKQLMTTAVTISYIFDLIIVCIIGYYLYAYHKDEELLKNSKVLEYTGSNSVYIGLRIMAFSLLMFLSLLLSSLCFSAADEILNSDDPSLYSNQYNECLDIGRDFMIHFIGFTCIGICGYIIKIKNEIE